MNDREQIAPCHRRSVSSTMPDKKSSGGGKPVPKKPTRKASNTKPQKQTRELSPLDHPTNWLPVAEVQKLLSQHSGNAHLAAFDLNEALERGAVRCMRRNIRSGDRQPVPPTFWADFELSSWSDGLLVIRRPARHGYAIVRSVRGLVFYVWKPDVVKRWPVLLKDHATPVRGESEERRGRKKKFTSAQIFALQLLYQRYRQEHRVFNKEDANTYLRRAAKERFGIVAHPDTIRAHIMAPVEEAGDLEK